MIYILTAVIVLLLFIISKVVFFTHRFFRVADSSIKLYHNLTKVLDDASQVGIQVNSKKIVISFDKHHFEFENMDEAYLTVEKMCNQALDYYIALLAINANTSEMEIKKRELFNICNEIRVNRWKKQLLEE